MARYLFQEAETILTEQVVQMTVHTAKHAKKGLSTETNNKTKTRNTDTAGRDKEGNTSHKPA